MNSQIPSEAMMINLSSIFILISKNSGSGETPTDWATESPIDQLMARPGMFSVLSQTRWGPIGKPFGSQKGSTLPPDFLILNSSSFQSGLWSIESDVETQTPSILSTIPETLSIWKSLS